MMSVIEDIRWLLTGDLSQEEGPVIARVGLRVMWKGGTALFVAYSLGWLTFLGVNGLAKADDVDRKIAAAVVPMSAQLTALTLDVHSLRDSTREQAMRLLRTAIIDAQVKKCRSTKAETAEIYRAMVTDARDRYHELSQEWYVLPSCGDL